MSKVSQPPTSYTEGKPRHGCYPFKYEISNQHTKTAQTIQKEDDFREKCQNRQKSHKFRGAIKNQVVSEKSGWSGNAEMATGESVNGIETRFVRQCNVKCQSVFNG